jgi:recombination protein RecR
MTSSSQKLDELINALRCLPGVGPKSAQRMAFYILERGRHQGIHLSNSLKDAIENIGHCAKCNNFSENTHCGLCQNHRRDHDSICIVETPADVIAIEQSCSYTGLYFVLMGHLSPLDGIGPDDLQLTKLQQRLTQESIKEVIIATNPTVEGEATAHYITEMIRQYPIRISRIAHGVPLGGELEFIDGGTLARALQDRESL